MNDEKLNSFILIIKKYYQFKDKLKKNINDTLIRNEFEEFYLIEESWVNELEKIFEQYKNYNEINKDNISNFQKEELSKELFKKIYLKFPNFINNFSDIINYIQNKKKFKLFKKSFIDSLYKNDINISKENIIEYHSGNKKIIIKFNNKNNNFNNKDDRALLIINPFDEIELINKTFIILIEDKILYKQILSEKNNSDLEKKYQKKIILFKKYVNSLKNEDIIKNDTNSNVNKKDILSILLNIFYYENFLINHKEKSFEEKAIFSYYLLNIEWFNEYKEYYEYNKIYNVEKNEKNIIKFNKFNSDVYIKERVNFYINKNIINVDKENKNEIINLNIENIENKNNNKFLNKCYIIHYKIIDMINNTFQINKKNITLFRKTIFSKFNNIYIYDKNYIIIGNIEETIFIPKYIFSLDYKVLEKEQNIILTYKDIENYLIFRNYNKNSHNLTNDKKEIIGKVFILSFNEENNMAMERKNNIFPNVKKISNIPKNINRNNINKRKIDNKDSNENDLGIAYNTQSNFYKFEQPHRKNLAYNKRIIQKSSSKFYTTQNNSKEKNINNEITTPKKTLAMKYNNHLKTENKNEINYKDKFNNKKQLNKFNTNNNLEPSQNLFHEKEKKIENLKEEDLNKSKLKNVEKKLNKKEIIVQKKNLIY